jgi:surfeit locus 1 family protein
MSDKSGRLFTVAVAAIFLGCLGLGIWQVQRLQWKEALLARIDERMALPAVPLPAAADWTVFDYRRVRVSGRFLHDREQILGPRSHRRQSGYHVITPFRLDDGRLMLINRGWVPSAARDPAVRTDGQVGGQLKLEGVLRADFKRGTWTPDYDAGAGLWYWYDIAGMARVTGLGLLPLVLEAAAGERTDSLPVGGVSDVRIPNNHLQYAITWFSLAAVSVVMYLFYWRRRRVGDAP